MPKAGYVARNKSKTESIREQIAVSKAIDVVNAVLAGDKTVNGKPIKRNQEWMAWKVIDKMLPSLQAVHIDAQVNHVQTLQDVNAQLMLAGINPAQAWNLLKQDPAPLPIAHNNEENQAVTLLDAGTHTPESQ